MTIGIYGDPLPQIELLNITRSSSYGNIYPAVAVSLTSGFMTSAWYSTNSTDAHTRIWKLSATGETLGFLDIPGTDIPQGNAVLLDDDKVMMTMWVGGSTIGGVRNAYNLILNLAGNTPAIVSTSSTHAFTQDWNNYWAGTMFRMGDNHVVFVDGARSRSISGSSVNRIQNVVYGLDGEYITDLILNVADMKPAGWDGNFGAMGVPLTSNTYGIGVATGAARFGTAPTNLGKLRKYVMTFDGSSLSETHTDTDNDKKDNTLIVPPNPAIPNSGIVYANFNVVDPIFNGALEPLDATGVTLDQYIPPLQEGTWYQDGPYWTADADGTYFGGMSGYDDQRKNTMGYRVAYVSPDGQIDAIDLKPTFGGLTPTNADSYWNVGSGSYDGGISVGPSGLIWTFSVLYKTGSSSNPFISAYHVYIFPAPVEETQRVYMFANTANATGRLQLKNPEVGAPVESVLNETPGHIGITIPDPTPYVGMSIYPGEAQPTRLPSTGAVSKWGASLDPGLVPTYKGFPRRPQAWALANTLCSTSGEFLSGIRPQPSEIDLGTEYRFMGSDFGTNLVSTADSLGPWYFAPSGPIEKITVSYRLVKEIFTFDAVSLDPGAILQSSFGMGELSGMTVSGVFLLRAPQGYSIFSGGGDSPFSLDATPFISGSYGGSKTTSSVALVTAQTKPHYFTVVLKPPLATFYISTGPGETDSFTVRSPSTALIDTVITVGQAPGQDAIANMEMLELSVDTYARDKSQVEQLNALYGSVYG